MLYLGFGNMFHLSLRFFSLRDFFFNWDLGIGPLGASYCWHRSHRLGISWRFIQKRHGKWTLAGAHRYWALGHTEVFDTTSRRWKKTRGAIWRWANPSQYHGEVTANGLGNDPLSLRPVLRYDPAYRDHLFTLVLRRLGFCFRKVIVAM